MIDPATPTNAPSWSDALIDVLERQQALVDELAGLAERQADLVADRRTDALLGLLTQRQRLIEEFAGAQEAMGGLTARMEDGSDDLIDGLDETRRNQVRELIATIGERLAAVMHRDASDQALLERARDEAAGALSSVDVARQARNAYRGTAGAQPRFADRRG